MRWLCLVAGHSWTLHRIAGHPALEVLYCNRCRRIDERPL